MRGPLSTDLNISNKNYHSLFLQALTCLKNLDIQFNNSLISISNNVKYLGVIFDNNSSWKPQIQHHKKKMFQKNQLTEKINSPHMMFREIKTLSNSHLTSYELRRICIQVRYTASARYSEYYSQH